MLGLEIRHPVIQRANTWAARMGFEVGPRGEHRWVVGVGGQQKELGPVWAACGGGEGGEGCWHRGRWVGVTCPWPWAAAVTPPLCMRAAALALFGIILLHSHATYYPKAQPGHAQGWAYGLGFRL